MARDVVDAQGRQINHVELLYRPGEQHVAMKAFEALGCRVVGSLAESGSGFFAVKVDGEEADMGNNVMYCSAMHPEHARLNDALEEQFAGTLRGCYEDYARLLAERPAGAPHFGIRFFKESDLEATVERIRGLSDPDLAGRLKVVQFYHPGDPGAPTKTFVQAFVETDIFSTSFVCFGQHIELQHQLAPIQISYSY